jgi:hypothetical protein
LESFCLADTLHLRSNYDGGGGALLGFLADRHPWSRLETLRLRIATDAPTLLKFLRSISASLRHLELNNVILIPGTVKELQIPSDNDSAIQKGIWEYVLPRIVQCLQILESLDIASLHFYPGWSEFTEVMFDLQKSDPENGCDCHNLRKKAVVDGLLCDKKKRQSLNPVDYVRLRYDHENQQCMSILYKKKMAEEAKALRHKEERKAKAN